MLPHIEALIDRCGELQVRISQYQYFAQRVADDLDQFMANSIAVHQITADYLAQATARRS